MKNLHLFQDGGSIIGDSHISIGCLDLKAQQNPCLPKAMNSKYTFAIAETVLLNLFQTDKLYNMNTINNPKQVIVHQMQQTGLWNLLTQGILFPL